MNNTLHILNGDSTRELLEKSSLEGERMVCREVFCEGPLLPHAGSDTFWMQRYDFFQKEFGVGKLDYFDKTIKEFVKIEDVSEYDEVVLWFEYDLFCQVNLIAVCAFLLENYKTAVAYYLVCVGKEYGEKDWKTLADYTPDAFATLYENKIKLSRNDLLFAKEAWQVYARNNKQEIENFDFSQRKKFRYFHVAMQQHLQRFPDANGFNQIERKIIELIKQNPLTEREMIKALLLWQRQETVYGFGDLQYMGIVKKLKDYYLIKEGKYYLN